MGVEILPSSVFFFFFAAFRTFVITILHARLTTQLARAVDFGFTQPAEPLRLTEAKADAANARVTSDNL